jgi:hypothetical protein
MDILQQRNKRKEAEANEETEAEYAERLRCESNALHAAAERVKAEAERVEAAETYIVLKAIISAFKAEAEAEAEPASAIQPIEEAKRVETSSSLMAICVQFEEEARRAKPKTPKERCQYQYHGPQNTDFQAPSPAATATATATASFSYCK